MKLKCERKMYPPRVQMTVMMTSADLILKLPVDFTGSSLTEDSDLKMMDIIFPLGNFYIIIYTSVQYHTLYYDKLKDRRYRL